MAFQADTGEYTASRRDYFTVDPRGLVVDWHKNLSRGGQEPPVDDELIALARDMVPRKGPGDSEDGSSGQINPVIVRVLPDRKLELIGGFRRLRAALYLIESGECPDFAIKYIVTKMSDGEAALANLAENIQRADLSPMQLAHAVRCLHEDYGLSMDAIAKRMKRPASWLAQLEYLTVLPSDIQVGVSNGQVAVKAALELAKLPGPEQRAVFDEVKASNGKTVKASAVKKKTRERKEKRGETVAPEKRGLRSLVLFLESKTGPAEDEMGRSLAEFMLDFIAGTKTEKQLDTKWGKLFPVEK